MYCVLCIVFDIGIVIYQSTQIAVASLHIQIIGSYLFVMIILISCCLAANLVFVFVFVLLVMVVIFVVGKKYNTV